MSTLFDQCITLKLKVLVNKHHISGRGIGIPEVLDRQSCNDQKLCFLVALRKQHFVALLRQFVVRSDSMSEVASPGSCYSGVCLSLQQVDGATSAPLEALAQLPEPPPGLLSGAQDSLSELLSMSHMSMEASPPVTPSELPLPPPPPAAEELPPPPPEEMEPEPEPAAEPAPAPRDRSCPLPPATAAVRARRPAVDSIPSIACSTGGGGAPLLSEQQQGRRRLSELPRSVSSEPTAGRRRMSELPRSASHGGGPQQPRRSSLMAQEARRSAPAPSPLTAVTAESSK